MSKRLHYLKAHNLSKLHDELLAAFPSLAVEKNPILGVEGLGDEIWLTVPDAADEAAIAAVVARHDPTPRVQAPSLTDQIAALQAAVLDLALGGV
jgi:hypothetical protein